MHLDVAESVKESDEEKAAEDENKQVGQGEGGLTCTADRGEGVAAATSILTTVTAASTVDVSVTVSESATPVSTSVTTQAEITPVNSNTTGKEYRYIYIHTDSLARLLSKLLKYYSSQLWPQCRRALGTDITFIKRV